ncbi:hypothetical protein [Halorussus salinus]|uniref:hypothetical protein n=1 Tax=Halorussus salinus TaxID=1364935 RepID=UPI00109205A1|nr:hypothetical protein [Halorussus salinus]
MVSKSTLKEVIEILGIFSMFALSVFVYLVWWLAFYQGGQVSLQINVFEEMWFEYVLWLIVTPLITLSMYYYLKEDGQSQPTPDQE